MDANDLVGRFIELKLGLFTISDTLLASDFFVHKVGEILFVESIQIYADGKYNFNVITSDCRKAILPSLYEDDLDAYLSII